MNETKLYKEALGTVMTEMYQLRAIANVLSDEAHQGITTEKPVDPDDFHNIQGLAAALRDGTQRVVKLLEDVDA